MQNLPKYPTREAMDKFNDLLQLHEDEYMQDWEIELARLKFIGFCFNGGE